MASAALQNNDFSTNTDDRHLEMFSLIWLDGNLNDTRQTEQRLRAIINYLRKFQDIQEFQQFIKQTTKNDRLVLIISGRMAQEIVPSIHHLRQVISIHIYYTNRKENEECISKYKKVNTVLMDLDELISRIQTDYKIQKKVDEPLSLNIFVTSPNTGKSTEGVTGHFIFSQILIDCLLQLKSTDIDKNELINICKEQYDGNPLELSIIQEFEKDYSSNKALWWYTRESFFYKTLNASLRTQNIHMIFLYRGFISDIYHQLQYNQTKESLRVYRSQLMSSDELDSLKQNVGHFISINSFFSTSIERQIALFLLGDKGSPRDLERVLFEINADSNMVSTKPFADIKAYSHFQDESEVLFMLGSVFRLESIDHNDNDDIWIIRMSLYSDDEHDLKQVLVYMKQQIKDDETNLRTLGKILWKMGKFELAEKYFIRLLKNLPENEPLLSHLYQDLGELASLREDYDMSIEWHRKSLEFKNKHQSTISSNISATNMSIGPSSILGSTNITKWKKHGITVAGGNGRGNQLNQLYSPEGHYIDDDHQSIYIVDYGNHRIVEWKLNGKSSQVVAGGNGQGNQMNQLYRPSDVIVDTKNNLLIICDHWNRRVVEWSRRSGTKDGEIIIPDIDCLGLTMDKNGYLYISDWQKDEVRRWKKGETSGIIVAGGNGTGSCLNQLNCPGLLAIDQDDSLYISDYGNNRVLKWMKNAEKGILVAGGEWQSNRLTQLNGPFSVTLDRLGNVYVADCNNHRIMCWSIGSQQGRLIVGGDGDGDQSNELNCPISISFDRENNLYVVDRFNHRVQKFEIDRYE